MTLDDVVLAAASGDAILFVGAGFSRGATSEHGEFPAGKGLAVELFVQAAGRDPMDGFDNVELSQVSEFFEQTLGRNRLDAYISQRFTCKTYSEAHAVIARLPWRRIYTTNYDDVLESVRPRSPHLRGITSNASLEEYRDAPGIVVHINGYAQKASDGFVLSDTDYATTNFLASPWVHVFRQDMAEASVVVFVGYSLYDLDISRSIVQSDALKSKLFFCVGKALDPISESKFVARGTLIPGVGVTQLADKISEMSATMQIAPRSVVLRTVRRLSPGTVPARVTDKEVNDFLLWGVCPDELLAAGLDSDHPRPAIRRSVVTLAAQAVEAKRDVVILGGLASGKSIAARQLGLHLSSRGLPSFLIATSDQRFLEEELTSIMSKHRDAVLIFDGVLKHHEIATWVLERRGPSHRMVFIEATLRWMGDDRAASLRDTETLRDPVRFDIDALDEIELTQLVALLDSTGLWGESAGKSKDRKLADLKEKFESRLRSLLLSFIKSPFVQKLVRDELSASCTSESHKKMLAIAFVLSSFDIQLPKSETEALTRLDAKVLSNVLKDSRINWLLEAGERGILSKSICVGEYFLRQFCDPAYVKTILVDLNYESARLRRLSYGMDQLFKQLGRFHAVQKLLPAVEDAGNAIMEAYFDEIKDFGPRRYQPLYWMHYSMVFIFSRKWERAKQCMETSRSLAKQQRFDAFQIETQHARYLLDCVLDIQPDVDVAYLAFAESKRIIDHMIATASNQHYPYRVAERYGTFYVQYQSVLTLLQRNTVISSIKRTLESLERLPKEVATHPDVRRCKDRLTDIQKITV